MAFSWGGKFNMFPSRPMSSLFLRWKVGPKSIAKQDSWTMDLPHPLELPLPIPYLSYTIRCWCYINLEIWSQEFHLFSDESGSSLTKNKFKTIALSESNKFSNKIIIAKFRIVSSEFCGAWWLSGKFSALHPEGRRFESDSLAAM